MTAWMWFLVVAAGAAVLGYFIFYGEQKTEQPESIATKARRDAATREVYRENDRSDRS